MSLRAKGVLSLNRKVTIYDIAREAGVSTATVTRVLAGHPSVKAATRERVQRIIDAHAYTPSASARDLERGQTKTLGIVLPQISNPYFARIFIAANEEAAAGGYSLWLYQVVGQAHISRATVDEILRRRLDGVLFAGNIWSTEAAGLSEAIGRLKRHMPVVAICPPATQLDCICLYSDLVDCARLPVRHLAALGHRRIAFVGGSLDAGDMSRRGQTFLKELAALGLPDDPAYHIDTGYDAEGGERAVLRLLSSLERRRWPTALIAFNDLVALGALRQLKLMGLRVPQDMAVIGCDNQFFCSYTDPPLTSMDLHPEELSRGAIRELLTAQESTPPSFSLVREATLVVRESCGAKLGGRTFD